MDKKRLKKNLDKISTIFLILYFMLYILLSVSGKYEDRLDRSGNEKLVWPSVPDPQIWEPKFLKLRANNWNCGGLFYCPLILLDRLVWHRNLLEPI
jgi:hypothetical protein